MQTAVEAERMTSAELREGLSVQENAFEHQLSQLRIQLRDKSIELHHQVTSADCCFFCSVVSVYGVVTNELSNMI